MTVYVDNMCAPYGRMKMCHMVADTEEELACMAFRIGVPYKWWQYKGTRKIHFDICLSKKQKAIEFGAIEVSVHELGFMLRARKKATDTLGAPRKTLQDEQQED